MHRELLIWTTIKLYYGGWLAIPVALLKKLGVATGDELDVDVIDGVVSLRPADAVSRVERKPATSATAPEVTPERRKPGRPRKEKPAAPALAAPKRPRGRPRKNPPPLSEAAPEVTSQPWKLVKKAELQAASSAEQEQPPLRRPARLRSDSGLGMVERRPFRRVEIRPLGPVVQKMAPLAERPDVPVPAAAMRRIMVEVRRREHHPGRPRHLDRGFRRGGDSSAMPIAPDPPRLVPPPSVAEMQDRHSVRPTAHLTAPARPHEAHPLADLGPVDRIEVSQLGADRHLGSRTLFGR